MAGEFAQNPVSQGRAGGRGQLPVQLGLPRLVRLLEGIHAHCQGSSSSPHRPPCPAVGSPKDWALEGSASPMNGPGPWGPCSSQSPVPLRPIPELQGHLSEDTFMNSTLPFTPSTTTQRQQTDLKTFQGTHSTLGQAGKSPCSWNQKMESFLPRLSLHKVLKRGPRKGYQLLLPSVTRQQAQQ
ncbi:hypothetical protein mRhiFer1_001954 [Rhinolophus ferrumequinum]|uniref:Uncharacterized protein n=1 Tax=Rhinolophus ferrumequinum TaxID=59479 RepID=A0A7J7VPV3_RHIFE|nr:hypothetical protein mRhiFer1_001954 [Rhinolophus ferrumequinum]